MFGKKIIFILISLFLCVGSASALPWDIDMFRQQSLKPGESTRSPADGTVPVGGKPISMSTEDAAEKLENPKEFNFDSVWAGKRLWNANCSSCHNLNGDGKSLVGPQVGAPSLLDEFYKNSPDGKVYGVVINGGANMPRYGYKFSEQEIWNLVNYLRFLQGKDVEGLTRPE